MSAKNRWLYRLSLAVVVFGLVVISSVFMTAQVRGPRPAGAPEQVIGETFSVSNPGQITAPQPVGVPDDWSHHHVIYSNPGTAPEALARGRFEEWYRIINDPRYILQRTKQNARATGVVAGPGFPVAWPPQPTEPNPILPPFRPPLRPPLIPPRIAAPEPGGGLWTMNAGPSGTIATVSGTLSTEPATSSTLTITGNGQTLIITASTTTSGSCTYTSGTSNVTFTRSGTTNTNATRIAALINTAGCGSGVYVTATAPGASVLTISAQISGSLGNRITVLTSSSPSFNLAAWNTLTNLTGGSSAVGAAQYPAKYSFNYGPVFSAANCASSGTPDFVVFPTGITGSATQATLIAYDNLYTGCTGTVPSVYWSYNFTDRIATSVVLSMDGTQVAFVDTTGHLLLVKWTATGGTLATPTTPTLAGSAAAYRTCTAPCYYSLLLSGETADTTSSPYVDYSHDTLYVGGLGGTIAADGYLHQVTGVFTGTPTETISSGVWPAQISTGATATPVYDVVSGYVYIGPGTSAGNGVFQEVLASSGAVTSSAALETPGSYENASAPVVDSTAKMLYVFVNDSSAGTAGDAAVYQIPINGPGFTSGGHGTQELLGQGALNGLGYSGAFDNTYYISANGASPTGNLYACGRASASQTPTLYQIPITAGVIGTPVVGPALATSTADCSPLTEFYNGTSDYIFLSVEAHNLTTAPITCPSGHGCLMSFDVTSPTFNTSFAPSHVAVETGGTSGLIIDNLATTPQAGTQIYFTPLVTAMTCVGNGTTGASATTTLSATITAAATSITVASGTNTATGGYVLIGTELMLVTAGGGTTTLTVIRGVLGTTAAAHTSGATVTFEDGCATQLSQAGLS